MKPFTPNWASKPGETIQHCLKQKGLSISEFAKQLEETEEFVLNLINADHIIDENIAIKLSNTLGSTVGFWIRRDIQYREALIRLNKT